MKAVHPATVLAVDDTEARLYFLSHVLTRAGFIVLQAANGMQGLTLAVERVPDLILLDVRLPDINGFEICRLLKAGPAAHVPVVFLSSEHGPADGKERAQFVGAEEFLSYPIMPDQLTVIVNGVLSRHRDRRQRSIA